MRLRQAAALLALLGTLVSAYLTLHQLGLIGSLACGPGGGCERVQASRWAWIGGVPVAAVGLAGYLALLAVALVGLGERWLNRPEPARWLTALSLVGVLFTAYLTYLEAFVIRDWCRWCLASAAIIIAVFAVSLAGMRRERNEAQPD
jgi:uncharacterized membrane protein